MANGMLRRRAAVPIALVAAVAIAAGGGSSSWATAAGTTGARTIDTIGAGAAPGAPALVQLEHLRLVAARAVSNGSGSSDRLDVRNWASVVLAGIAFASNVAGADSARSTGPDLRSHAAPPGGYSGRNHVWIPSLGISRQVQLFPCSRSREPDNVMYRWGCAGSNNVYLLGHAWGVMKPLHDAYARGRLSVGMLAFYADGAGRIRAYAVTEWRVVNPLNSSWAIAGQSVPSMTLQTCVGPRGSLRLNVRLVEVPL